MTRRVPFVLLLILGAAITAAGNAAADRGGYAIRDFHTEIAVQENSDLLVTEHLTVDFSEPRHGIYRSIPVRYTDPRGFGYSLGFRLLGVTGGDGDKVGTKTSNQGRYVNIRIGDADRTVQGKMVYVIRYRIRDALLHTPEHDELYWNATGNEWRVPIDRASATVVLPAPLLADSVEALAYTGGYGSTERNAEVAFPEPGTVTYTAQDRLGALEGLTVDAVWPAGYVAVPGSWDRFLRFLGDNWILAVPLLALGFLFARYRAVGRDPRGPAAIMVRYEPPPGVTAGDIGTLVDESVDQRDITAMVVDLAVRGYLTIRVEEKDVLFGLTHRDETVFERRREKSDGDLLPHETRILDGLFESGDRVEASDLKQKFYTHLPGIRKSLYQRLVDLGYFSGNPHSVRARYGGLGILAGAVTFGAGLVWAMSRGGVMPYAFLVPLAAGIATAVLFFAFAPAMPRRTAKGVRMRAWARGFEEFVDRVEKDRLEADRARNVFETLLPYAMALGVASAWARKFEGIYTAAGPGWYVGSHPGMGFSTVHFERSLSSTMGRATQAMTAAPRSSGSSGAGGGGFSGGGGGGGGGGSW